MKLPKILKGLDVDSINYLQASANYTVLHTQASKPIISAYTLQFFEEALEHKPFIRLGRSIIVRHDFITAINDSREVRLKNNQIVRLPRRVHKDLATQIENLF